MKIVKIINGGVETSEDEMSGGDDKNYLDPNTIKSY